MCMYYVVIVVFICPSQWQLHDSMVVMLLGFYLVFLSVRSARIKLASPSSSLPPDAKTASWDLFYTNADASFPYPDSLCQVCQALHQWILLISFVCSELAYKESLYYTSSLSALSYPSYSHSYPRPLVSDSIWNGNWGKSLVCMYVRQGLRVHEAGSLSRLLLRS